jgi:hypothetical protein
MSLLTIVLVLCVVVLALWLLNTYVPLPQPVRTIVSLLVVVAVLVWLLDAAGVIHLSTWRSHR